MRIYSVLQERLNILFVIKIIISTFLKIQGERDEQRCERDDDDRQ